MRNKKKQLAIDLTTVDPHGRVDVLALQFLNKFAAARLPELVPVIESNKGVIHATLNERLGPHVIPVELAEQVRPFVPMLSLIAGEIVRRMQQAKAAAETPRSPDEQSKAHAPQCMCGGTMCSNKGRAA